MLLAPARGDFFTFLPAEMYIPAITPQIDIQRLERNEARMGTFIFLQTIVY